MEDRAKQQLKLYHQQMVSLQTEIVKLQSKMLAVIEIMDWSPEQANEAISIEFFIDMKAEVDV